MNVGATNGIDAFLAAREAAARRLDSSASAGRMQTRNLTRPVSTMENVAASQASKAPTKGQHVDFLA